MCKVAASVRAAGNDIPLLPGRSKSALPTLDVAPDTTLDGQQQGAHHGDHDADVHQHQQVTTARMASQNCAGDNQGYAGQHSCDEDHLSAENKPPALVQSACACAQHVSPRGTSARRGGKEDDV